MRTKVIRFTLCTLMVLWLTGFSSWTHASSWQNWRGSRGWGLSAPYQKLYKAKDVVIVSGNVLRVEKQVPIKGMYPGIFLILQTGSENLPVHLGPLWYIERLDIRISPGDKVEVKGAKISFNEKPAVIAAEVRQGNNVLILRDNVGVPVWAGWGWIR